MFDTDDFLNQSTEAELSTQFTPVPEGEYNARADKLDIRTPNDKVILDVTWVIDDDNVREVTGMDNPTVRQSVFLDMTADGGLDTGKGKNVQLGRLREALGQNKPGEPWSFRNIEGSVARVKVSHREYEGNIYADVKGVAAL